MRHPILRWLPALTVIVLFALAARSPEVGKGDARPFMPLPVPPAPPCENTAQAASGDSLLAFPPGTSVLQPLANDVVVSACSLSVTALGWSAMQFAVREWDPTTLAPDAHTVALRLVFLNPSSLQYYSANRAPRVAVSPPVVARSLPGVADPPRSTLATEMLGASSYGGGFLGGYTQAGAASLPTARLWNGSVSSVLPGGHPLLAHSVCTATGDVLQARIAQAVSRTDQVLARTDEVLQYFRVPSHVDLCWLEFAIVPYQGGFYTTPSVQILDVSEAPTPAYGVPSGLTRSAFIPYYITNLPIPQSLWTTATAFDHVMVLEPGHDYALRISDARAYNHYTRTLTGSEPPEFTSGIGALYTRDSTSAKWVQQPGRALSFKLVGLPTAAVVGVPRTPPSATFVLRVSPNPTRSIAEVVWSGAVGPVRVEVFDARGRRVATGSGGAAGHWTWSRERQGASLPVGVYFVQARDSEGGHATERIVVVR